MGVSQHNMTSDGQPITERDQTVQDHCPRCDGTIFVATFVIVGGARRGFGMACMNCRQVV